MAERVTFTTSDGVEIVGNYFPVPGSERFAILLHIRPETKESWGSWIQALNARGFSCLAYDQRGHGESTMAGTLDYETQTEEQSRAKRLDLEAAVEFLKGKGAVPANTMFVGGSIGANLAIRFLSEHPDYPFAIALSPGLTYRGVATDDAIVKLSAGQQVILVSSDDDPYGSFESCKTLHGLAPSRTVLIEKSGLGHGTYMTDKDPSLIDELIRRSPEALSA